MSGYNAGFYDTIRAGTRASADVVVPVVLHHVASAVGSAPRVLDVGCGEGWWAQRFADAGCDVVGVDGGYVETSPLGERFVAHDLRTSLPVEFTDSFDVAVCLEVAEHLPASRAASFVADLVRCARIVVFSAAIPGQGGTGHVNEQWPGYWEALFNLNGYQMSGALRWWLWNDDRVENWYRQNLVVATADPSSLPSLFDTPLAAVHPVVHPVLYDARRHT